MSKKRFIYVVLLAAVFCPISHSNAQKLEGMKPTDKPRIFEVNYVDYILRQQVTVYGQELRRCQSPDICLQQDKFGTDLSAIDCSDGVTGSLSYENKSGHFKGKFQFDNNSICYTVVNYLKTLDSSEISESNPIKFTLDWTNKKIIKIKFPDVSKKDPWAVHIEDSSLNVVPNKNQIDYEQQVNSSNNTDQV